MPKKGENIYKRKDGRWEGRYLKGYGPDGKAIYGSVYGRTYAEVKAKLAPLKFSNAGPQRGELFRGSFKEYALSWLGGVREQIKPSTYGAYHRIIHRHILPGLGGKPLRSVTAQTVQAFLRKLKDKNLSAGTVRNIYRVLSSIIGEAVDAGVLENDVRRRVTLPSSHPKTAQVLTIPEQRALETAALCDPHGLSVLLALHTGMRLGEICALMWEDIDLERNVIMVNKTVQRLSLCGGNTGTAIHVGTPKSRASQRLIPLSDSLSAYLRKRGPDSRKGFVLSHNGKLVEPRLCQYRFQALLHKAGLRRINFHALRHTFATRCMELRMDITTLSQILGHSSVKLTLDTYTDSLWEHKAAAMRLLDGLGWMSA